MSQQIAIMHAGTFKIRCSTILLLQIDMTKLFDHPHHRLDDRVCRRRHSAPSFAGVACGQRRRRRCATIVIIIIAVVAVVRHHESGDGVTKGCHCGGGVGLGGSGCHHRRGG